MRRARRSTRSPSGPRRGRSHSRWSREPSTTRSGGEGIDTFGKISRSHGFAAMELARVEEAVELAEQRAEERAARTSQARDVDDPDRVARHEGITTVRRAPRRSRDAPRWRRDAPRSA